MTVQGTAVSKLVFKEENLGWSIWKEDGEDAGYLGKLPDTEQWVYIAVYNGQLITLSALDQIRHKLANLEQLRLLQIEREK